MATTKTEVDESPNYRGTIQCRLVFDSVTVKVVSDWVGNDIDHCETVFGEIPKAEDRAIRP